MTDRLPDFLARIDCCFPVGDLRAGLRFIDEARTISVDAVGAVLAELADPGRHRDGYRRDLRHAWLRHVRRCCRDPLLERCAQVVESVQRGRRISGRCARRLLDELLARGLWCTAHVALRNVEYESGDALEAAYDAARWQMEATKA